MKKVWILSIGLFFAATLFFGKSALWWGVSYAAKRSDPTLELEAGSLHFTRGGLCVENFVASGKLGRIDAKRCEILLRLNVRSCKVKPHVALTEPVWQLPDKVGGLGKSKKRRLDFTVTGGMLQKGEHRLPFAFTSGLSRDDLGLLELDDGAIEVMLKRTEGGSCAIARFQNADLSKLQPFSLVHRKISWVPQSGIAAGYISAELKDGEIVDLSGDIRCDDVALWHPRRQFKAGAKSFSWKGDFPTGELHLSEGYLLALHPRLPVQWGLRLDGKIEPNKGRKAVIDFKGAVVREDAVFPIEINGEGKVGSHEDLQATFNITGEGASYVTLQLNRGGYGLISGDFSSISSKQLLVFRDGLAAFLPKFRDLHIEGVGCNAKIDICLKQRAIDHVNFKTIEAKGVAIDWPSQQIQAKASDVKAHGVVPCKGGFLLKDAKWELALSNGAVGPIHSAYLKVAMDHNEFKIAELTGQCAGMDLRVDAQGSLFDPRVGLSLSGGSDQLAKLFKVDTPFSCPFAARVLVSRKEEDWSVAAKLTSSDECECTLGLIIDQEALKQKDFKSVKGWVEAEKVPDQLYGIVLDKIDVGGEIKGCIDVSGTFSDQIELSVSGKKIIYETTASKVVVPGLNKEPVYQGPLAQHVALKGYGDQWTIDIPLFGASLHDKINDVLYENLNGNALIKDKALTANAKGFVSGVNFKASAELGLEGALPLQVKVSKMNGSAEGLIELLTHFEEINLELPVSGKVEGDDPLILNMDLKDPKSARFEAELNLTEGRYELTEHCFGENLTCTVKLSSEDKVLEVKGLDGGLTLIDGDCIGFDVSAPKLRLDTKDHNHWEYDFRIESQTHDLMRLKGELAHRKDAIAIDLDPQYSHLFDKKIELSNCILQEGKLLRDLHLTTKIELKKIPTVLQFLKALHVAVPQNLSRTVKDYQLKGLLDVDVMLTHSDECWSVDLNGSDLSIKGHPINTFALKVDRDGDLFSLDHLNIGGFHAHALAEKNANLWSLTLLDANMQSSTLKAFDGGYDPKLGTLSLELDECHLDLAQFKPLFAALDFDVSPYLKGVLDVGGKMHFDPADNVLAGHVLLSSDDFSNAHLQLESKTPIAITIDTNDGIALHNAHLLVKGDPNLEGTISIGQMAYKIKDNHFACERLISSLSPELIHHLATEQLIPLVECYEKRLMINGIPFNWDNHLETTLEFYSGPGSFSLLGKLKSGYYWIGNLSCYLEDGEIKGTNTGLTFDSKTHLNKAEFFVHVDLPFDKGCNPVLVIDDHSEFGDPLKLNFGRSDALITSALGHFCGLDIDFQCKPGGHSSANLALTGDVSIDWNAAAKVLPENMAQMVQDCDLGRGYNITGDLNIDLKDPENSTFKGFFKGKDFELLGYRFKNLLSKLEYGSGYLTLDEMSLADDALALQMPHINISKNSTDWNLSIPTLTLQDLRPSRLQKCGIGQKRLKPFVIRNLEFRKIEGKLSDRSSFTGQGELNFINTFKRDLSFFDIPKEIISRIGLDIGLLVPVCGDLKCHIKNGRLYFDDLNHAFSDGDRSQFFLSSSTRSYIELDGKLHVDIRMKQFVLLKITEMFTIKLRGNLADPKFSLK